MIGTQQGHIEMVKHLATLFQFTKDLYLCIHQFLTTAHLNSDEDIRITCPCNEHPLTPHFCIVKMGFTGVYIFSFFAVKHRLWVHVRTTSVDCGYSLEPPH